MQIHCPRCGAPVPVEEVNIQALVARCCNEVFSFADQLPSAPSAPSRATVNRPESVQVSGTGEVLTLTQRWFNGAAFFLLFFCTFWDGFLVVWYTLVLTSRHIDPMALIFPLLHVAAGVGLTYLCAGMFVNRTILTVTRRDLSVRYAPLPFPGQFDLPIADVDQFYSEEVRGSKGSRTYSLSALLKNGNKRRLITGLTDGNTALFFEQTLESWYGIEDRPIEGELQR